MKPKICILLALICGSALVSAQNSMYTLRQQIASPLVGESAQTLASPENLASPQQKNQALAAVYSLILPGMGELYAEGFDNGRYSLVAEAALWISYISFQQYGAWLQEDARSYASAHAGTSPSGKDDQFYVNVGNFSNMYDYNDKKLRDRNISEVYDPSQGYLWNWDSEGSRERFRSLRISSDKVFNNSRFVIGAIVVNHVVSALNASRLVRHFNKNADASFGSLHVEPNQFGEFGLVDGMRITYVQRF